MNIVILGGGISGLSAAWFLRKNYRDAKISLLEKEDRLGGRIETMEKEGAFFEKGPRTFMVSRSEALLSLIEEVGLKEELLFSDKSAAKRYLWHRGKLRSMGSLIPMLLLPLLREPFREKKECEDESIYDFACRRFSRKIAETLFDPMALGVFAGDIRKLSLRSCFPFLHEWEQKIGSVLRGMLSRKKQKTETGLFTLRRGMGSLIEEMQKKLAVEIAVGCPVEAIRKEGVQAGGRFWKGDWIVSALPGPVIGRLTGKWVDFPAASVWVVNLGFSEDVLAKKGFGYLVPTNGQEPLLGMIWDSSIFPLQNPHGSRLTAMVRGSGDAAWAKDVALRSLKRHLGIAAEPSIVEASFAKEAIPQFEVGYGKRLNRFQAELKEDLPCLTPIGNYVEGASVDACIRTAKKLK